MDAWRRVPPLPPHCEPQGAFLEWYSSSTQTCVPTPAAFISTVLGTLSFLSWLFAQVPQVIKNYKIGSTAGLSTFFLLEWFAGDTTNLVGAILTKQAAWQILIATYYTTIDFVLCWQLYHYSRRKNRTVPAIQAVENGPNDRWDSRRKDAQQSQPRNVPFNSVGFPSHSASPLEKSYPSSPRTITRVGNSSSVPVASPKTVLMVSMLLAVLARASPVPGSVQALEQRVPEQTTAEMTGRYVAWTSAILYNGSRLPQLYKNWKRKSTAGLSLTLFVAAFCGNCFYSASLLTNPLAWSSCGPYGNHGWAGAEGSDRAQWIESAAPFFIGASGVLLLDLSIGIQFLLYSEKGKVQNVVVVPVAEVEEEVRGRPKRTSLSGWMRGWVPSPTPSIRARAFFGQERRPLLSDTQSNGSSYGEQRRYGGT